MITKANFYYFIVDENPREEDIQQPWVCLDSQKM
jgi:hypothetical protein